MSKATIRDATLLDLPYMGRVAEAYSKEAGYHDRFPLSIDTLFRNLAISAVNPDAYLRLLVLGGEIIGGMWGTLATVPWSDSIMAQDNILYISPEHRKGGNGILIIRDWEHWAKERGAVAVNISTASGIKTERTCRLFTAMGYIHYGQDFRKEI